MRFSGYHTVQSEHHKLSMKNLCIVFYVKCEKGYDMDEKTTGIVVEVRFSDGPTLKELLLEILVEKIGTADS